MNNYAPSKVESMIKLLYIGVLHEQNILVFFFSQNVQDITSVNNLVVMKRSALTIVKAFYSHTKSHFDGTKKS